MRLAAAGLGSAFVELVGCARPLGEGRATTHWPTLEAPLTPRDSWYFYSIQGAYEADIARYRLQVGGLVDERGSFTLADLRDGFPVVEDHITLSCVGNNPGGGLLSSALFRGARLVDVIDAVSLDGDATGAIITGLDGFVAAQSLEDLKKSNALLAYEMGIEQQDLAPLPVDNGFPLRVMTPGLYGYMQPKWIDSITFVDQGGYHEVLRRSIPYFSGKMQLASGFSQPRNGWTIPPGETEVIGYAFGDGRAIDRVNVKVDGDGWQPAEIIYNDTSDALPPYLWALWRFNWEASPGRHALTCRATYADGETQIDGREFPYSGGSLYTMKVRVEEA